MKDLFRRALRAWGRSGAQYSRFYRAMEAFGPRVAAAHPLQARLPSGAVMECDIRDHVQRHIYFQGVYEPIEAYLFTRLARPGSVVVDAGANVGQYSLLASDVVGPDGVVHAFEPVAKNFARLRRHVETNCAKNIRPNALALWHEPAELRFGLPPGDGPNDGSYSAGAVADSSVPVVNAVAERFDDYARENIVSRVDLVKMDVEGAELSALRGMSETLNRDRPVLLMEVNRAACARLGYDPAALWEFLSPFGYTAWEIGLSASSWRPLMEPNGVAQANVLFAAGALPPAVATEWNLAGCLRWGRGERP